MLITDVTYKIIFINFFFFYLCSTAKCRDLSWRKICSTFLPQAFVLFFERHMQRPANNLPKAGGFAVFFFFATQNLGYYKYYTLIFGWRQVDFKLIYVLLAVRIFVLVMTTLLKCWSWRNYVQSKESWGEFCVVQAEMSIRTQLVLRNWRACRAH